MIFSKDSISERSQARKMLSVSELNGVAFYPLSVPFTGYHTHDITELLNKG